MKSTIFFVFILTFNAFFCKNEQSSKQVLNSTLKVDTLAVKMNAAQDSSKIKQEKFRTVQHNFSIEYITGHFSPEKHADFVLIAPKYSPKSNLYLRKDAYEAFVEMATAAAKEGIKLTIISAARNFNVQKSIWEAKWTGKRLVEDGSNIAKTIKDPTKRALKILEYSSMPGTSRHHWGTDIDLNNLTNYHFESGSGVKTYQWLVKNAATYGFAQPYTKKGEARPNGYNEEKWHWSYLPIARKITEQCKTMLKNEDIKGFIGYETAVSIDVVQNYVLGINPECL